jgi:hypothetical protein
MVPRSGWRWAGLVGLALAAAPALAEPPPPCHGKDLSQIAGLAEARQRRADDLVNADGLFWRVDKASLPPSYLFGTIHSTDDEALAIARRAAMQIPEAKIVATELGGPFDVMEKADIGAAMLAQALDRDHDTFADASAPDRGAIEKLVAGRGYPTEFAHHLRLWFLAVLTAAPSCEAKREAFNLPEVDEFLAEQAKAAGIKVVGLETPQEQLDAIASVRPEVAAAMLSVAARDPETNDDVYATLLKLYRQSRPADPGRLRRGRRHERQRTRRRRRIHRPAAHREERDHGRTLRAALEGRSGFHRRRRVAPYRQGRPCRTAAQARLHRHQGLVRLIRRKASRYS